MPTPLRSTGARALAASTVLGLSATLLAATPLAPAAQAVAADDELASRFTLAVVPDTQFYARYSADQFMPRYGTDPFAVQTQWLAENADELRIPFVAHLGDIVDRVGTNNEWVAADAAMQTLDDADLPYSILAGNHDVRNSSDNSFDTDYTLANEPYLQWFGTDRAAEQSTYGGSDPTGFSQWHIFEAEGQQFMVMALPWRASDATLDWAADVIEANPTVPVILTTHDLLAIDSDAVTGHESDNGQRLWNQLIRDHDQIFLTFNGHFHGATKLTKQNDFGNDVTEVLIDYQMAYEGGNGYLGLLEFDLTNDEINAQTVSPWVVSKDQDELTSYDQPVLEGQHQQYTLDIDFADRFSGFTSTWAAGTADEPSLTQAARDILLDGFVGVPADETELPGNSLDYPEVDGTLAHWRFGDAEGLESGVVGADASVPDVSGNGNELTRAEPTEAELAAGAEWSDVTVETDDVPAFSSDGAAVCFANSDRQTGVQNSLTTEVGSALTNVDLSDGYTIETFVKMGADWTADKNQWSKFITRTGNRSGLPGMPWSQWDYTASPTALGISNLREFQYTTVPADATIGDKTAWSGEIMVDTWAHVAVVGEADGTLTMYVDGAPVLRNTSNSAGMAFQEDMPWILGADWVDDKATQGWNGCIGETRIIDHATEPTEWLTQRADLTGFAVTTAPTEQLPDGTAAVRIAGTGFAGAEVTAESIAGGLPDADTTVGENGEWAITFTDGLEAGDYEFEVAQALGSRASDPQTVAFSIAEPEAPVEIATTTKLKLSKTELKRGGKPIVATVTVRAGDEVPLGRVQIIGASKQWADVKLTTAKDGQVKIELTKLGNRKPGTLQLHAKYAAADDTGFVDSKSDKTKVRIVKH